ncbi:MAG: hypothetical protein NTW79_01785 [Candidatus Berkelbacteria bacterium]|nr:hypothetical protein [Candidatus Berkelbacteria bacterium]
MARRKVVRVADVLAETIQQEAAERQRRISERNANRQRQADNALGLRLQLGLVPSRMSGGVFRPDIKTPEAIHRPVIIQMALEPAVLGAD